MWVLWSIRCGQRLGNLYLRYIDKYCGERCFGIISGVYYYDVCLFVPHLGKFVVKVVLGSE